MITEETLVHAVILLTPFAIFFGVHLFSRYRRRNRFSKLSNLPHPKRAPSDFVIYRYDERGRVEKRWVYADGSDADVIVGKEKRGRQRGRLFKDGDMIREW